MIRIWMIVFLLESAATGQIKGVNQHIVQNQNSDLRPRFLIVITWHGILFAAVHASRKEKAYFISTVLIVMKFWLEESRHLEGK